MKLTLRGETIDIEIGQEVTFYRYVLNNDKVEFWEDKVIVNLIEDDFEGNGATDVRIVFQNNTHSATLHHYEIGGDFYLSINDKNVLDFLARRYKCYEKQEKRLHSEIESLSKQIENLNNEKSKLGTLIQEVSLRYFKNRGININERFN